MSVYWLEQSVADVPADDGWLSPGEGAVLNRLRYKRAADWRLGRWTAKCAAAAYLQIAHDLQALRDIEIRAAADGAPEVFHANRPAPLAISLTHRGGTAACAVAPPGTPLGCDLELIEQRSEGFMSDYFTAEEQALIGKASAPDQPTLLALLWSAKESALKALREGLRLDTRWVAVQIRDELLLPAINHNASYWRGLQVRSRNGELFHGWWQQTQQLVRTVVTGPRTRPPIPLKSSLQIGLVRSHA